MSIEQSNSHKQCSEIIIEVLHSFKTQEETIPLKWLFDLLQEEECYFIGSRSQANAVGMEDEWSDEYGGFWVLNKSSTYGSGSWVLVGPGDLEEALEDITK